MSGAMKSLMRRVSAVLLSTLLLGSAVANEQVTYFHNDVSGTPLVATNASGEMVWKENYRPYGDKLNNQAASSENRIGFHGKPYDDGTGLSYMGARYYDPVLGRFMGTDPEQPSVVANTGGVGLNSNDLHTVNRYAYVNNNPYRFVDPDGHSPKHLMEHPMHRKLLEGGAMGFGGTGGAGRSIGSKGNSIKQKNQSPATDKATGQSVGRIVVDRKGNAMIEPVGGRTVPAGKGGQDTHTLYPNGSNYQRLNPQGHGKNSIPHGHGHQQGTGPGMKGQGPSIDPQGNVVPWNSPAAHWPVN